MFDYAYCKRETSKFTLPPGWMIEALPSDTAFKNGAGRCQIQFAQSDQTLTLKRVFELSIPFFGLDQYKTVRDLFQAQQDFADLIVILSENPDESDDE